MNNITSGLLFCLIVILFVPYAESSQISFGDKMGMSDFDYQVYEDIRGADLIVQGTLYDRKSLIINGSTIPEQTEGKILIKEILKQSNNSNATEGMIIDAYEFGGTIDNETTCYNEKCPIPEPGASYERIFYLNKWDLSGKGRYYLFETSIRSIDELKPAIANVEKGLPIELMDMSFAAQFEREQKKGIITTTTLPNIINITPNEGSAGTKTQLTILGTNFGNKSSNYSTADIAFYSGYNKDHPDYFASGRQDTDHNKIK
ncbi:IPT/TIG domain-containing protein [Methanospirillum stamsii]|nr:IPT/TIG domain-containing protein [Methanospirillum stamsii]